ncbi:hybrid sensor histidine kinase/response regulator [Shewanella youngdeokensis]|uniref:histidine kinase n=1 Tax=Shewanella youngdeokensis TaxID=2999068 RepID=A0ABZ0JW80_9GAMM|nr:ATP-binding protein [Shewanella sp. DAU334]
MTALFDKKNGMHLFTLFIVLGAIAFMATSYVFVRNQASETARIIDDENLKGKFSAIEQYVSEFIESHERNVYKISTSPFVVSAVLEGVDDPQVVKDKISLVKPHELESYINLYDFAGDELYLELELSQPLAQFIVDSVKDGSMLINKTYIFFSADTKNYLLITEPVIYNDLAEGVIAYIMLLDESNLIERLIADKNHWFGISQNQFNWSMTAPENWHTEAKYIASFDINLLYASSPEFLQRTESDFLTSLFLRMLFATCFTILVLYILGRKILVSPFQTLARSEQLLEQQTAELISKEAESTRLARVAKYMRDGVVFTDADVNITWVNGAFEKMCGFDISQIIGRKPFELLQGPDTDIAAAKKMNQLIIKREFGSSEIVTYSKSKKAYWFEVQIGPLYDDANQLEGFMAVARDITERKKLEQTLKDSVQKADAANVAKSQFLASMSHELRTPMNGVLGMTELIKDSSLTDEQQEMVDTLLSSGKHMLSVLNDILDFSKIEAGKLNLNVSSFSVKDIEVDIAHMYQALCDEKGLTFSLSSSENAQYVCVADKTRIQQILQNLLNNAWKFTQQGNITASIKVIDHSTEPKLELDVADTGIGISQDKQSHIFLPFSQAERDTTRRFGGTGLGLAIVSELVSAMKGTIELNSVIGVGSQFRVTIPIKLGEHRQDTKARIGSVFDGSGLKVLIVEDNKINVTVMSMLLKKRNFSCDVAENGQLGVEMAQTKAFDLIMMDNHMPVMDGIDAAKAITALELARKPIIIGCTADAFEHTRVNMMEAGCIEVITKPINSAKLDEVLLAVYARD